LEAATKAGKRKELEGIHKGEKQRERAIRKKE